MCCRRQPLAPPTAGTASSLLATPTRWLGRRPAHSEGDPERWWNTKRSYELSDQMASLLPTPRTTDQNGPGHHGNGGPDLRTVASELPTPTSASYRQGGTAAEQTKIKRGLGLLPTPVSRDWKGRGLDGQLPTTLLPTPVANDDNKTPEAHLAMKERMGGGRKQITSLQVLAKNGLDPTSATTPPPSSGGRVSHGLRLNPSFVEWMLGTPLGWSDPDSVLSATEYKSNWPSFWEG